MFIRYAFLLLTFCISTLCAAALETITSLKEVQEHLTAGKKTLVVFGCLNTLVKTDDCARWPYQWEARLDFMQAKKGYHKSRSAAENDLRKTHPFTPKLTIIEDDIADTIATLRASGCKIVALTRLSMRMPTGDVNKGICDALKIVGVDLTIDWIDSYKKPVEQFTRITPFMNGIIHAGSANIGEILMHLIAFSESEIDDVIVVDDNVDNLGDYTNGAEALGLPCTALYYGVMHQAPAGFRLARGVTDLLPERRGYQAEQKASNKKPVTARSK